MPVTVYDSSGNLTTLAKVLKEHFDPVFQRTLDRDVFLLNFFPRKDGKGNSEQWIVHYQGNTAVEAVDEDDPFIAAGKQEYERAEVPFSMYRAFADIGERARIAAAGGAVSYVDILSSEVEQATEDLKDAINDDLLAFARANTKRLYGIGDIVNDTGVYAGIDRATATWWRSVVLSNGGTPRALTAALIEQMLAELEKPRRKARTNYVLASRTHWNQYGNLMYDRRRYVNEMKLDIGVEALDVFGIPFVAVPNMATGKMFFLDTRSWGYYVFLPFEVEELPKTTTDTNRFMIKHFAALVCKAPYQQGVIADLSA